MNLALVKKIANAVLYEGYILYPYRPSAVKNQQRWNFGALCPRNYSEAQSATEAWTMQTECLVEGGPGTAVDVKVRFLHLLERLVGVANPDCGLRFANWDDAENQSSISDADINVVASLEVNGKLYQTWQEAVERDGVDRGLLQKFCYSKPQSNRSSDGIYRFKNQRLSKPEAAKRNRPDRVRRERPSRRRRVAARNRRDGFP